MLRTPEDLCTDLLAQVASTRVTPVGPPDSWKSAPASAQPRLNTDPSAVALWRILAFPTTTVCSE